MLDTTCIKNNYPPPVYTVLSSIKHEHKLESHYSIQCEAMDFVAIGNCSFILNDSAKLKKKNNLFVGHSNKKSTAQQVSAQNVIHLWEKMNSKNIQLKQTKIHL